MLRQLVIAAALLALSPAAASAAQAELLMPGVTYERQVQFTSHGPVAVHVIRAPRPGGAWRLEPAVSNGAIVGRERLTAMQRAVAGGGTAAGVNGDLSAADGRPEGIQLRGGVLEHAPHPDRSSIGIAGDGALRVARIGSFTTWQGSGPRRNVLVNELPGPNQVALFTPSWGPLTPPTPGAVEAVVDPLPPARLNEELRGPVTSIQSSAGGTAIPPGGAVLVGRGTAAGRLAEEAPAGSSVALRLQLTPSWDGVADAIGGGPLLVRAGKPIFRTGEIFPPAQLARNARTAVGQGADGRLLLVVVDGRRPGYSTGLTSFELAQTMVRLGAVTAAGLEAGGAATMAFDGTLLNRPSDAGGERAISNGLFVIYDGVVAAPPSEPVLSPNGDGIAEVQSLSYKLGRPSHVQVRLLGPGTERVLDSGPKAAGVQRFTWNGTAPDGSPEPDGAWRLAVTATDDLGRASSADRLFTLNRTLGGLAVSPGLLRVRAGGPRLQARFALSRPATVTTRVETPNGTTVAVVARQRLAPGTRAVSWNGRVRAGRLARTGRYVLRVIAVNDVGRVELTAPFSVRRVAAPAAAARR